MLEDVTFLEITTIKGGLSARGARRKAKNTKTTGKTDRWKWEASQEINDEEKFQNMPQNNNYG